MKKLVGFIALALGCLDAMAQAQVSDARSENQKKVQELLQHARDKGITPFNFTAKDSEVLAPYLIRLRGHVRFFLNNGMTVATEDAVYHIDTGEITTRGDAHLHMGPSRPDPRGLSQFGVK
jgi:hypothetical protein